MGGEKLRDNLKTERDCFVLHFNYSIIDYLDWTEQSEGPWERRYTWYPTEDLPILGTSFQVLRVDSCRHS